VKDSPQPACTLRKCPTNNYAAFERGPFFVQHTMELTPYVSNYTSPSYIYPNLKRTITYMVVD